MRLNYYKEKLYQYRYQRDYIATKIQKNFRMFRVRRKYLLYIDYVHSERLKVYNAATCINNFCRCVMARQIKKQLIRERYEFMLYNARMWQESWSDSDNAWYYVNVETGESAWEPPASGYTTAYQKLMISTGELIDDPLLAGELGGPDGSGVPTFLMCGECLKRHATKKCEQCRTNYCTQCLTSTHNIKGTLPFIYFIFNLIT
jgi:hypothetical protein